MLRRRFALLLGALASLAGFAVGFVNDDLVHRLWLEGKVPGYTPSPLGLYEFTGTRSRDWLVAQEYIPWFTDPAWRLRFFRPLSSLSLAVDHWLGGRSAPVAHVQSLLWFLLLASAVVALLKRWLPGRAAALASAIYVLAGGQAMSMAWIASRHTLVGGALGAISLWIYARAREDRWGAGSWLAPMLLAIALTGSEVALGVSVFVVLYELLERREARGVRVRAALPMVAVTLTYLGLYVALGFGAHGSAAYVSPFTDPLGFLAAASTRVPQLGAELFAALPSMLGSALPAKGSAVFAGLGALATLSVAGLLHAYRSEHSPELQRRLWFLGLSSVVSLLPMAGGFVGGRMLPLSSLGAAAVLGALLDTLLKRFAARSGARRVGVGALLAALALPHLLLAPLVRLGLPLIFRHMEQVERDLAERAELDGCAVGSTAYLLTGSDPTAAMYGGVALGFFQPERAARLRGFTPLSMAPNDQRFARISEDAFELTTSGDHDLSAFEGVYRQAAFRGGEHVRTRAFDAEVLAAAGGMPTRVRFRFEGSAARACFLRWHDGALRHVVLKTGEALALPHEPGPTGF